jgi:hypothetical protein
MADRTSAGIFHRLFRKLATDPTDQHRLWAREFWEEAKQYDFSWYQLECDEELLVLGLARRGIDPDYPHEGETIFYGPNMVDTVCPR